MSHDLSGACLSCAKLFNRFVGFNEELRTWFCALQIEHTEMHISCAGRGRDDQEAFFQRGASRAHYGESAHNYNAAIDLFELRDGQYTLDPSWFKLRVAANLYPALKWYGMPGAEYYELPHVEISDWRSRVKLGSLSLVEV